MTDILTPDFRDVPLDQMQVTPTGGKSMTLADALAGPVQGQVNLVSAASITSDCGTGNVFVLTLGTNATLANPVNQVAGSSYVWRIVQDATGGRTLSYGTAFKWPGGIAPVLSTAAGAVDLISAVSDGSALYAVITKEFG